MMLARAYSAPELTNVMWYAAFALYAMPRHQEKTMF